MTYTLTDNASCKVAIATKNKKWNFSTKGCGEGGKPKFQTFWNCGKGRGFGGKVFFGPYGHFLTAKFFELSKKMWENIQIIYLSLTRPKYPNNLPVPYPSFTCPSLTTYPSLKFMIRSLNVPIVHLNAQRNLDQFLVDILRNPLTIDAQLTCIFS